MNRIDFGTMRQSFGWIAFYRIYHHAANQVLRHGKDDIIFATQAEAEAAAKAEFLKQMNSPIVAESITGPTTQKALAKLTGDRLFERREERV